MPRAAVPADPEAATMARSPEVGGPFLLREVIGLEAVPALKIHDLVKHLSFRMLFLIKMSQSAVS